MYQESHSRRFPDDCCVRLAMPKVWPHESRWLDLVPKLLVWKRKAIKQEKQALNKFEEWLNAHPKLLIGVLAVLLIFKLVKYVRPQEEALNGSNY